MVDKGRHSFTILKDSNVKLKYVGTIVQYLLIFKYGPIQKFNSRQIVDTVHY